MQLKSNKCLKLHQLLKPNLQGREIDDLYIGSLFILVLTSSYFLNYRNLLISIKLFFFSITPSFQHIHFSIYTSNPICLAISMTAGLMGYESNPQPGTKLICSLSLLILCIASSFTSSNRYSLQNSQKQIKSKNNPEYK